MATCAPNAVNLPRHHRQLAAVDRLLGFCCIANASRTQLLNLHRGECGRRMLALFGIPPAALPEIKRRAASSAIPKDSRHSGRYSGDRIDDRRLPPRCSATRSARAGCVKATYGTGSSVMAPVKSAQCDIDALAYRPRFDGDKAGVGRLEGAYSHTGDAVAWMA